MTAAQSAFDPDYPTPAAIAYRDGFRQGALESDLTGIPSDVLSWAIDRAIAAQCTSVRAGRVFANVYWEVRTRREPRGGYSSPTAYLLACYEGRLKDGR